MENIYYLEFSRRYIITNTRFLFNQSICKVKSCYVQRLRRRYIYKKVNSSSLTLPLGQGHARNFAQYPLQYMTYLPAKFEADMSNGLGGNAFTRNILFDLTQGQCHTKHCPLHHLTYVPAMFATTNGKGMH